MHSNPYLRFFLIVLFTAFSSRVSLAQLNVPSDGSDGNLSITQDTVIDLGLATTGKWSDNNSSNAGNGVYDPEQWAVVFKYKNVTITQGATNTTDGVLGNRLSFKNHPTRAPVVWLVSGNVTIDGVLDLNGGDGRMDSIGKLSNAEPGPGGFRGGVDGPIGSGAGLGIGGGAAGVLGGEDAQYSTLYGNPEIIPLIGGSGGGSQTHDRWSGAGAGGGILIVASGSIDIGGLISANGGREASLREFNGSGGAVRLVSTSIQGAGTISCLGGVRAGVVQYGRIRLETPFLSPSLVTFPETIAVQPSNPPKIWPSANAPKVQILSVDSVMTPSDPTAPLRNAADIAINNNGEVDILLATTDFPIEGVVECRISPKFGAHSWHTATLVSGNINLATWKITTTLPQGFVTFQARATAP